MTAAIVSVKNKYQVVIPQRVRDQLPIKIGDILEARVENGRITLTPKSLIDTGLAESMRDYQTGGAYGPFRTARAMVASLRKNAARLKQPRR